MAYQFDKNLGHMSWQGNDFFQLHKNCSIQPKKCKPSRHMSWQGNDFFQLHKNCSIQPKKCKTW